MRPNLAHALFALALLPVGGHAESPTEAPGERSPGDMTVEERGQMMQSANAYNSCVYEQATNKIDSDPDIRRVADNALGACQPQLEALSSQIRSWKFPEYFATGFARTVRDRAARSILPELASRKGG
ncbi:MAG: hypothetical protein IPM80_23900 [Proteobacteria bacterium]|jgi:hypothetical protein|nr:hypothetical protein [Pseudomonadota bacterium]